RAREIWDKAPTEQRQRGRGVQVQVLFHLSRALRDLGEFDAAAEALDTCCALDHGSDPPAIRPEHVLANRGELNLRRSDLAAAAAAGVEALRQVPAAEPLVRVELARVELAVGRRAAALRHVERALACRREGGFAEGLRLAAELCEQLGRAADARRYLEQLARLAPADAEVAARAAALAAAPGSERPPS